MSKKEPFTLGRLIQELKLIPKHENNKVRIDFGQMGIGGLVSYRGYYNHLALVAVDCYKTDDPYPLLNSFIETLEEAVSGRRIFAGWKGGDYRMSESTLIWVVTYSGMTSDTGIVGVEVTDSESYPYTVIRTKYFKDDLI